MNDVPIIEEGYWVVIPHSVLSNKNLQDIDKLVYGEISSLARKNGCCTAHNSHFKDVLGIKQDKLTRSIKRLEEEGLIDVQLTHVLDEKKGTYRKIFLGGMLIGQQGVSACISRGGADVSAYKIDIHKRDTIENSNVTFKSFLELFNTLVGVNYRGNDKVKKSLHARLEEGYTLQDIEKAINNAKENAFLMGDNDGKKRYLTPEYILRANKLDEWLNCSTKKQSSPRSDIWK